MHKYNSNWDGITRKQEVSEARDPFPNGFKKGEMLMVKDRLGRMVKGKLVSYQRGKVPGGAFTLQLTGEPEHGTIEVGAKELFAANPSKLLAKKEEVEIEEADPLTEAKDDPVRESTVSESANPDLGRYWTDLDDMATNIQKATKNVAWVGKFDVKSYLLQIVGSLRQKHAQQRDFLQGLIYSLEAVHKKTSAPSKHGNMEILNDLSTVIRELKKYQK